MATAINQYRPDYAVPPGWVLDEHLEARGLSQAEFARRCGRSAKLISEIIAGKAPVEPETALQFEKVLGLNADIWLGIEKKYQLHLARKAEFAAATRSAAWLQRFPIAELVKRGAIRNPGSDADAMSSILSFFGVASVEAWNTRYGLANVAYRHSPSFRSDEAVLATWLRLGEIEAQQQVCAEYNDGRFRRALREIRSLTSEPFEEALAGAQECCKQSGVALILVRPLSKMALSGAARWLSPRPGNHSVEALAIRRTITCGSPCFMKQRISCSIAKRTCLSMVKKFGAARRILKQRRMYGRQMLLCPGMNGQNLLQLARLANARFSNSPTDKALHPASLSECSNMRSICRGLT